MTDPVIVPLDVVADAIDCFWNAALGAAQERQSEVAADLACVMVQGFAAIATRLREHAAAPKAEPVHDSDCALHNEPAHPNGPCDCAIKPVETLDDDDMKRARELRHAPDSEDNERFSSWFGDTLLDVHEAYVKLIAHPEAPKVEQQPVAWLRDAHGGQHDECLVPAAQGDPDAFPVYRGAPASDELLEASVNLQSAREMHRKNPTYKNAMVVREASDALDQAIAKHKGPQP